MCTDHFAPARAAHALPGCSQPLRTVAAMLVTGLLVVAQPALGASGCTDPAPADSQAAAPSSGLKAYVDPDTGELLDHPPAGETPEPPPEAPTTVEDVPVEVRPDGTVVADVGDRYRMALHAEIVDGKLVTCHRPLSREDPNAGVTMPEGRDEP